ncbi:MAG: sugar transferase [Gammaproteobacteria bacterium]|nr:sugar transferase [Gammaproteobacteria bacterium]
MKRTVDIILATFFIMLTVIPCIIICLAIYISSHGPVIYWSQRIGKYNKVFLMPKFRTMHHHTPEIATHLLIDPDKYLTALGRFLRKTSLDELPQLWSVLHGSMAIVGPRPSLVSQNDLIDLRTLAGVHRLTPGITGWAQVHGRDNLSVTQKVKLDIEYMNKISFFTDIKIIGLTILKIVKQDDVTH